MDATGSDKGTTTYPGHGYHRYYERLLLPAQNKKQSIKLLEIGTNTGNSVRGWEKWFPSPDSQFFGVYFDQHFGLFPWVQVTPTEENVRARRITCKDGSTPCDSVITRACQIQGLSGCQADGVSGRTILYGGDQGSVSFLRALS